MPTRRTVTIVLVVLLLAAVIPAGIATARADNQETAGEIPETAIAALIGGGFGFLATWLGHRRTAKKDDLDALRAIIDEMRTERGNTQANYERVLLDLEQERQKRRDILERVEKFEQDCENKDRQIETYRTEIEDLRCEIDKLRTEVQGRDKRIADLVTEVDELRALMEQNGLTPPPRRSRK
ncbi:MAG TPA: hypothetical protein PKD55_17585 [Bellilinea sp.]|nr:hypothetical protein [Bellilinea sp.]